MVKTKLKYIINNLCSSTIFVQHSRYLYCCCW